MAGKKNLIELIKKMKPTLNDGEYVFVSVKDLNKIDRNDTICEMKEKNGISVVLARNKADALRLPYEFVTAWITLTIHSSLEAVGLTAAFASALAKQGLSCNVIAGYNHDHIFVDIKDAELAMQVLTELSDNS